MRIDNDLSLSIGMFDAVLFDLDGTIYEGTERIPGANSAINYFRENGKRVFFTTNNSTKTRKQIFERLVKMGIDVEESEVLTSGYLAADYALRTGMKDIYIFGSVNLIHEFRELGVPVNQNEGAENLLIGYDPSMTYEDLTMAVRVALNAKCIMACNRERVYPGEKGNLFPGCGAMTAPIEWCANRPCDLIVGKPNTLMIDYISSSFNINPNKILVVGDTYESDIEMAKRAGCYSVLISSKKYGETVCIDSIKELPGLFSYQEV